MYLTVKKADERTNELLVQEKEKMENLIYEIREKQVMLDSDLVRLYKCKNGTKEVNQAVKNNIDEFLEKFFWILTNNKYYDSRSKNTNHEDRRYNVKVFYKKHRNIGNLTALLANLL